MTPGIIGKRGSEKSKKMSKYRTQRREELRNEEGSEEKKGRRTIKKRKKEKVIVNILVFLDCANAT